MHGIITLKKETALYSLDWTKDPIRRYVQAVLTPAGFCWYQNPPKATADTAVAPTAWRAEGRGSFAKKARIADIAC